jgi:uncharacterized glyoxalase superfamily metalloenzyme YdcJ
MATTPPAAPKPEASDDNALAQATARASESLARIEQRRKQVLDARADAIALTRTIVTSKAVRRAGADFEPLLNEIATNADLRLQAVEEQRKQLAVAMKKARAALPSSAKKPPVPDKG